MEEKRVSEAKLFIKLYIKEEQGRIKEKRGKVKSYYMKTKAILRPPIFILKMLDWNNGDSIGVTVEKEDIPDLGLSLRMFNITKNPLAESVVVDNNIGILPLKGEITSNLDPFYGYEGKIAQGLAAAKKMLPNYREAEKYLNDNYPPKEKAAGDYWIYDPKHPQSFRLFNYNEVAQVKKRYEALEDSLAKHYTPDWVYVGGRAGKYKQLLKNKRRK